MIGVVFSYILSPVSCSTRYGFNGAEKNFEMEKGLNYDLGARMYNSRVARMFSRDPREDDYPWQSTYAYYRNNPVAIVDILGEGGLNDPEYEGTTEGEVGSACQSESTCSGEDKFTYVDKYWHSGTDGGADKGWYTKSEYDAIVGELAANYMQSENSEFASIKLSFDISKQSGVDKGNSGYLSGSGGGSTVEESDYFKSLFESFGQPDYAMEPSIVMNGEDIVGYNAISGEPFAMTPFYNVPASGTVTSVPFFFTLFSSSPVINAIYSLERSSNKSVNRKGEKVFEYQLRYPSANLNMRLDRGHRSPHKNVKAKYRGKTYNGFNTHINLQKPGSFNLHLPLNPAKWKYYKIP